jgi:hypothetical protein
MVRKATAFETVFEKTNTVVILLALSDVAKGAQRRISLRFPHSVLPCREVQGASLGAGWKPQLPR